jgi:UDP-N-acetylglucosamine 2-epimerase
LQWVITKPNIDAGNSAIIQGLEAFAAANQTKVKLVANLGQQRYLSTLAHATIMVGNSSSGIIESASYRLPTVNIGDRQAGRECPDNVMNTPCETDAIVSAIQRATSPAFEEQLATMVNPYGDGRAVERMMTVLNHINWQDKATLLKKGFADLPR